jgi:hypothetical protein
MKAKILCVSFIVGSLSISVSANADKPEPITVSGEIVVVAGDQVESTTLTGPSCDQDQLLITHLHVAPSVETGNTLNDVVNLGDWAAYVEVFQSSAISVTKIPLTVLGNGPQHLSATLPAGQQTFLGNPDIFVEVRILGGVATHRFNFDVHVTAVCGEAYVSP